MAGYGAPYPKSTPSSPAQRLCRLLALSTMMHTRSGLLPCARINQQRRRALSERTARPTTTFAYRDPLQTRWLAQRGTLYRNEWGSQVDARTVALENAPVQLRGARVRLPLQHRQRRAGSTPYRDGQPHSRRHGASYAIHRSAWKWNSTKFGCTILNIQVYEGGQCRNSAP